MDHSGIKVNTCACGGIAHIMLLLSREKPVEGFVTCISCMKTGPTAEPRKAAELWNAANSEFTGAALTEEQRAEIWDMLRDLNKSAHHYRYWFDLPMQDRDRFRKYVDDYSMDRKA